MAVDMWEPLFQLMKPFKIQPEKRVTWNDYKKVCWIVARNELFVALPLTALVARYRPLKTTAPLPGALETIGTFIFCLLCEEFGFFAVHRLLHSRRLYKHFHKLHQYGPRLDCFDAIVS